MRRDEKSKQELRVLVGVDDPVKRHQKGTSEENEDSLAANDDGGEAGARPARFELATSRSGGERSIH
jgi:hypothetical protein